MEEPASRNLFINVYNKLAHPKRYGQHQLLPTTDSPTISTCTTVTNLSSWDIRQAFGSKTINNRRMQLEENLRVVHHEIEPIHTTAKAELADCTKGSINGSICTVTVYNETTTKKSTTFNQIFTALAVSMVSMVVGFVTSYTSPARVGLMEDIKVDENEYSWVCSLMPLFAIIGGLVGGQLIEFIGRKWTIVVTVFLFVISWVLIAVAANVWFVYAGRGMAGFSVGIASLALPVYLGETLQPEVRGTLGLLPTGFGNVGILICFFAGTYLRWHNLAWVGVSLPIAFLIFTLLIPETPRWYISKKKDEEARKSLQWLRGKDANIEDEFNDLSKSQKESDEQAVNATVADLFSRANVKPLFISLGLMTFQQLSGINAVIFYATFIFQQAGSTIDEDLCTIIIGIMNFVSAFVAAGLIDRLGRKILLYVSSVTMILTLGLMGVYFYLKSIDMNVNQYGWLPLASCVMYILGFSLGFGPIPWLMMGEILPAKIRGSAASLATAFNWSCTFVVTKTFVNINDAIGFHGTFWLFTVICTIGLVFVILCVPETQGQSLEDIERTFAGLKVRRMSSVANLKPLPSTF